MHVRKSEEKGVPCARYRTVGIIKSVSNFPEGCLILFFFFFFSFLNHLPFPQPAASILVSLLFYAVLTYAHSLRFCSLWAAE